MFETDALLIEALINKDEQAYYFAVKNYHGPMIYLARSIAGDKIADEVVQEAWLSVMRALPKFERRSRLKTWILSIVANEAKSRLRKEKRHVSLEASLESINAEDPSMLARFDNKGHWSQGPVNWTADSPEALLAEGQLADCLNLSIEALPTLQNAALNLKQRQDFSLSEICNILDVSESNVRVLLHRARNKVYQVVEHFQLTGECRSK